MILNAFQIQKFDNCLYKNVTAQKKFSQKHDISVNCLNMLMEKVLFKVGTNICLDMRANLVGKLLIYIFQTSLGISNKQIQFTK